MAYKRKPFVLNADHRGYIEGVTHVSKSSSKPLCHFFGGLPYALPPIGPYRFAKPRPLPACYRYGTRINPGRFNTGAAVCPQAGQNGPARKSDMDSWDEDCLQLNIWVPAGQPPEQGWPVLFFIHGGWLQLGSPNTNDLTALLSETPCQCVVVMAAYRLNAFGFLASHELAQEASSTTADPAVGNYGFWDQRLALEWTYKNISAFAGNPSAITVSGYSAGSHSAFHQLSFDLYQPRHKQLIKRAIMHSNGPGMQPKSLTEAQTQFDALLNALHIPSSLPAAEKLARLRAIPADTLTNAAAALAIHEFRAVTDGAFVRHELFDEIDNGVYAARLRDTGVQLVLGECRDENFVYGAYRLPRANSREAFRRRLYADYPYAAADAVLDAYSPRGELPTWRPCADWLNDAHGFVFADLQVHALERGFVDRLVRGGAADCVRRYRVEWRAGCCDALFPRDWGVTHGTDLAIWFFGNGMGGAEGGLTEDEKAVAKGFADPLWKFITGQLKDGEWGTEGPKQARRLKDDGQVDCWDDQDWARGVGIFNVVREALKKRSAIAISKL